MNCDNVADKLTELAAGSLSTYEERACKAHIAECRFCRDALHGTVAMRAMRLLDTQALPADLLDRVTRKVTRESRQVARPQRFWLGAAFGSALAASLLAAAIALGVLVRPVAVPEPDVAQFYVTTDEARPMNIAIDVDRPLQGARISVVLAGDVEVEGFDGLHELTWSDDLEAGVNKLTLPLRAVGDNVGQVVVRLSHPQSEQMFVVKLKLDADYVS